MGLEAKCAVVRRTAAETVRAEPATVLWEGDALIVRGPARVKVARADIKSVIVKGNTLTIAYTDGSLDLALGAQVAARWKEKMASLPKSRLSKLGIAASTRVAVLSVDDDQLANELQAAGAVVTSRVSAATQVVLLGVSKTADLARIGRVADTMSNETALWVIHPKGVREVADTVIFGEAKRAGLTYTKVASFSEALTAEKLVRPLALR